MTRFHTRLNLLGNIITLFLTIMILLLISEAVTNKVYKDELISKRTKAPSGKLTYVTADVYITLDNGRKIPANVFNEEKIDFSGDAYKIVAIGDSLTEGIYLTPNETYTHILEALMNNAVDKKFEILNFGQAVYNSVSESILLKEIIIGKNPDMVILQFFLNDFGMTSIDLEGSKRFIVEPDERFIVIDNVIIPQLPFIPLKANKVLLERSKFLRFVSQRMYNIKRNLLGQGECSKDSKKCNSDAIRDMAKILKKDDILFVIINIPSANKPKSYCSKAQYVYTELKKLAFEENVYYIDLCDYMQEYDNTDFLIDETMHYNKRGNEKIASIIFENLIKSNIIPVLA